MSRSSFTSVRRRSRRGVVIAVAVALTATIAGAGSVAAVAPDNDLRRNARHISDPVIYSDGPYSTADATLGNEPVPSCGDDVGKTVWYRFRAPIAMRIVVQTRFSDFDTVIQVYRSTSTGLARVKCNDDYSASDLWSGALFNAAAGGLYYFQVGGFQGATGQLEFFLLTVPSNDQFAKAAVASDLPFSYEQDTSSANTQAGEPSNCAGGALASTVWFRYTPSSTRKVSADTFGSAFDTVLNVYRGTSLASLVEVKCDDDAGGGYQSQVSWNALGGQSYYIQVSGFDTGEYGDLVFTLTRD